MEDGTGGVIEMQRDAFDTKCEAVLRQALAAGQTDPVYVIVMQCKAGLWPEVDRVPYEDLDEGAVAARHGGGTFRFQARLRGQRGCIAEKQYSYAVPGAAAPAAPAAPAPAPAAPAGPAAPLPVTDANYMGLVLTFISNAMRDQQAAQKQMMEEHREMVRSVFAQKTDETSRLRDTLALARELAPKGNPGTGAIVADSVAKAAASIAEAFATYKAQPAQVKVMRAPGPAAPAAAPAAPAAPAQLPAAPAAPVDVPEDPVAATGAYVLEQMRAALRGPVQWQDRYAESIARALDSIGQLSELRNAGVDGAYAYVAEHVPEIVANAARARALIESIFTAPVGAGGGVANGPG